jgi:hypothetical protein
MVSIKIMTAVWEEQTTQGSERLVLLALADSANDEGFCWPSLATIAKKCNIERRYVINIIKNLEAHGLIEVERRKEDGKVDGKKFNKTNMYRLLVHLPSPPPADVVNPASPGVVNPASLGGEAQFTRVVNYSSPESLINRNEPEKREGEPGQVQIWIEQTIGPFTPGPDNIKAITEMERIGATLEDIQAATRYFLETVGHAPRGPANMLESVKYNIRDRKAKATPARSAKSTRSGKNGKPDRPAPDAAAYGELSAEDLRILATLEGRTNENH